MLRCCYAALFPGKLTINSLCNVITWIFFLYSRKNEEIWSLHLRSERWMRCDIPQYILSTITFELFLLLGFYGRINFLISFCAFAKSEIRLNFGNLNILISFSSYIVFADFTTLHSPSHPLPQSLSTLLPSTSMCDGKFAKLLQIRENKLLTRRCDEWN